ncbi:hypothetical protein [Legionella erythra]|uniref:Uncharacterized protein n=1 Tax=Legionella erythra TaxID=448 RepID=A0A0W0TG15_LEGER|nr:hypothetical protein [Legionella erythra]KTC94535.1 hypothetical protein Lery_2702 [Legionella erythra]
MMQKIALFFLSLLLINPLPAQTLDTNHLYYHMGFPAVLEEQTETLTLDDNTRDLLISNLVAGALYAYLIHQHDPKLAFNSDYITGSLFGQLLQENLQTTAYKSTSPWINPDPAIRSMLLAPGQGGPYQINDYGKRLESGIGLINFTVLQKSLGYRIDDQDSGQQTIKKGPDSLDNKYFGPLAAAYFQYNTLLRFYAINQDPWGPSATDFPDCLRNLQNPDNNILDMLLNAGYNAGPWAPITKTYFKLCANANNPAFKAKINRINDYTLSDKAYQQAIDTQEAAGSTFILYPRQIRFYLDELYNNPTALPTHTALALPVSELRFVFAQSMHTLGRVNNNRYETITVKDAEMAFDNAAQQLSLPLNANLDIGVTRERQQLFQLLGGAIDNLALQLNLDFSETTEKDWATSQG